MSARFTRIWKSALLAAALIAAPGLSHAQEQFEPVPEPEQAENPEQPVRTDQPNGGRDDVADLAPSPYDADGALPKPRCVTLPNGKKACRRVVAVGRAKPASFAEAPWQTSLWSFKYTDYTAEEYRIKPEWMRRHKCGGTLVAPEWVLTAAHCLTGSLADHPFQIRIGASNLTDPRGKLFPVRAKFVHPSYDPVNKQNDIALLRIDPVRLPGVRPVRLIGTDTSAAVAEDSTMQVYGYGKTRNAEASALLLKASIVVWPLGECRTAMRSLAARITPSVLCALGVDGSDSCQGDSGGPLIQGPGPGAIQTGIVSWGKGCGQAGSPGVYVYVARYLPWIWATTGGRAGRPTLPAGL